MRHGALSRIALRASLAGDLAVLKVADNGARTERPGARPRFGLAGMRERIEGLGGELAVDPGDGHGWTVTAVAPLRLPEAAT